MFGEFVYLMLEWSVVFIVDVKGVGSLSFFCFVAYLDLTGLLSGIFVVDGFMGCWLGFMGIGNFIALV